MKRIFGTSKQCLGIWYCQYIGFQTSSTINYCKWTNILAHYCQYIGAIIVTYIVYTANILYSSDWHRLLVQNGVDFLLSPQIVIHSEEHNCLQVFRRQTLAAISEHSLDL